MSNVLNFDLGRQEFRKRASRFPLNGAEILFFTGVRYERHDDPPTKSAVTKGKRRHASGRGSVRPPGKNRA